MSSLEAIFRPNAVAVVGASADVDKIGGRPIAYMRTSGFVGDILPVNPRRAEVQGLRAYSSLQSLPLRPDLAIVAVPARDVEAALADCADAGVRAAIIMASGFGESGDPQAQRLLAKQAVARGMRIVGPNSQGIANFSNGMIASFSTMLGEVPAKDGPVAIIAQSGAMSVVPYALLRERGVGVRYSVATGNEADLTVADFALAVLADPAIRLLLLYFEDIPDPHRLAEAASVARARGVPIVALKAGRSEAGQKMAQSHTGALASEDRVVDAFLTHHGIWRAVNMREMLSASELHLAGWQPEGRRLLAISNSGASCVMAADEADRLGMPLAVLCPETMERLQQVLPDFASATNPIDLTAMLRTNSRLLTDILPALSGADAGDVTFFGMPLAGAGYDLDAITAGAASFARATGRPLAVATPLPAIGDRFRTEGIPAFQLETDAIQALDQLCRHRALIRRAPAESLAVATPTFTQSTALLDEWQSMELLRGAGLPVVPSALCRTAAEVAAAFERLGQPVVVKGCSAAVPHKSDYGLVRLNVSTAEDAVQTFEDMQTRIAELGHASEGVIVARMCRGRHELAIGARLDPRFGPVVLIGDGGRRVEQLKDYALLLHPAGDEEIKAAVEGLRVAALLRGGRGDPPCDLGPAIHIVKTLGALVTAAQGRIASIDLNPVIVGDRADDTIILDALVELAEQ